MPHGCLLMIAYPPTCSKASHGEGTSPAAQRALRESGDREATSSKARGGRYGNLGTGEVTSSKARGGRSGNPGTGGMS